MSQDVRPAGVRQFQGVTVFDNGDDRPSEFGDPSTRPSLWDEPSRFSDSGLETRKPRASVPQRRSAGGLWPVLLVVFGVGLAGVALLLRLFSR